MESLAGLEAKKCHAFIRTGSRALGIIVKLKDYPWSVSDQRTRIF